MAATTSVESFELVEWSGFNMMRIPFVQECGDFVYKLKASFEARRPKNTTDQWQIRCKVDSDSQVVLYDTTFKKKKALGLDQLVTLAPFFCALVLLQQATSLAGHVGFT